MKTILRYFVGLALTFASASGQEALGTKITSAARSQVGKTVRYDPSYETLAYPHGDVDMSGGVCTDVIIRALRSSLRVDLQKAVHEDMSVNFRKYPQSWGLRKPDKNIDHRRVPNLQVYFKRRGYELSVSQDPKDYQPGDLVTCLVPPHLPHIMIVSDRTTAEGRPLVIHNIGAGTQEEDRLFEFKLTGHYRLKKTEPDGAGNADEPLSPPSTVPTKSPATP
ncbi:MAG: DUF1287 domain-containing protein [Verrucomicrobiota bacterium]